MRCINCGYDNESGVQVCVKCGTLLSSDDYMGNCLPYNSNQDEFDAKPTVLSADIPHLKQTVVQLPNGSFEGGKPYSPKATVVQDVSGQCPRCGYPMMGNYCSNCGYEHGAEHTDQKDDPINQDILEKVKNRPNKCVKCNAEVPAEYQYCPFCGELIPQLTISVFEEYPKSVAELKSEAPNPMRFLLTPVVGRGQTKLEALQFELVNDSFILNRDNIAPGNRTVTSKEQAEIRLEDGKWLINNRSKFDSTFVAAIRPIELQPGDIILVGDQRFRFTPVEKDDK